MEAVTPTSPELLGRIGQHRVARRVLDRLADPLDEPQEDRELPLANESEGRHGEELHDVAADGDLPVGVRAVREVAGDETERVAQELAGPRRDPDPRRARAEDLEERPDDRASALVGPVREEAGRADHEDEHQRRSAGYGLRGYRLYRRSFTRGHAWSCPPARRAFWSARDIGIR